MNAELAIRIRARTTADPRVTEKAMFGGVGFLLNGNMFAAATSKGALMLSIGKTNDGAAKKLRGADQIDFDAPRQGGFLIIDADLVEKPAHLAGWLDLAMRHAATKPPK